MNIVKTINHRQRNAAEQIYVVLQRAYRIEADLLNIVDFPPLRRGVSRIMAAESEFYGFWQNDSLTAIVEVEYLDKNHIHIATLVVDPDFFRQGLGSRLLADVLDLVEWGRVTVDTAVANTPAIHLYKKLSFIPLKQWQTPDQIPMITLFREKA